MDLHVELERLRRDNAQLQHNVAQLEHQIQELRVESTDLREICGAKGVNIEDALAARQHCRMFARALTEHPLRTASTASDALNLLEIGTPRSLNQAESTTIQRRRNGTSKRSMHASLNPNASLEAISLAAMFTAMSS